MFVKIGIKYVSLNMKFGPRNSVKAKKDGHFLELGFTFPL